MNAHTRSRRSAGRSSVPCAKALNNLKHRLSLPPTIMKSRSSAELEAHRARPCRPSSRSLPRRAQQAGSSRSPHSRRPRQFACRDEPSVTRTSPSASRSNAYIIDDHDSEKLQFETKTAHLHDRANRQGDEGKRILEQSLPVGRLPLPGQPRRDPP